MAGKKSTKTKNTAEEQASAADNSQEQQPEGSANLGEDLEAQMMAAMQMQELFGGGQTQALGLGTAPTVMTREQIEANLQDGPETESDDTDLNTLFEDLSSTVQEMQAQVDKRLEKTARELATQLEVIRSATEQQHKALNADLNNIDKNLEKLLERQQLTANLVEKIGHFTLAIAQKAGIGAASAAGQINQAPQQQQQAAPTPEPAPQTYAPLGQAAHTPAPQQQQAAPTPAPAAAQDHGVPEDIHKPILTAVPKGERPPVPMAEFCDRILKFLGTYNVHLKPEQVVLFLRSKGCVTAEGTVYSAS